MQPEMGVGGYDEDRGKSEDGCVAFHHIVASKGYRDNHQKIYSNHVEEKDI